MPKPSLDYFLADKQGAELTGTLITEACQALRHNRNDYLALVGNEPIIAKLIEVANLWRSPDYELRRQALTASPEETGFPREVLAAGLDACFADWTQEKFFMLLTQEFGDPTRLQSFANQPNRTYSMVHGPQLIAHIAPGNLPVPIFQSIAFGLLLRSAQFVKCATGKSLLPRLFGHSLHYVEPGLASSLEIAEWDGGNEVLESSLFTEADCVVASGNDNSINSIRQRLPLTKRLIGYGHRVSFGYVEKQANEIMGTQAIISHAADDVVAWNQCGCLSPHVIYVEQFGTLKPERFAEMLAEELERFRVARSRRKRRRPSRRPGAFTKSERPIMSAQCFGRARTRPTGRWCTRMKNSFRDRLSTVLSSSSRSNTLRRHCTCWSRSASPYPRSDWPPAKRVCGSWPDPWPSGACRGFVQSAKCSAHHWPGGTMAGRLLAN